MIIDDRGRFESYLAKKLGGDDLSITSINQTEMGLSGENFFLSLEYRKEGVPVKNELVVRRQPVAHFLGSYDLSVEFRVLDALQDKGISIPKTYWYEPDKNLLERPFYVMEKVDGEVYQPDRRKPSKSIIPEIERASLSDDFVENIVAIHKADWRGAGLEFLGDPGPGRGSALKQIEKFRKIVDRTDYHTHPLLRLAYHWLVRNAPENDNVTLVHGDYRTGNYISKDGHIRAVLDWELVHLGDPHDDIAYILHALWRSAPPENLASHLMKEDEFIWKYEERSAMHIDLFKVKYYALLLLFKGVAATALEAHHFTIGERPNLRSGIFAFTMDQIFGSLAQGLAQFLEE